MNEDLIQLLLENGASMAGFAKLEGLYGTIDPDEPRSEDSETEPFRIPEYPIGISILLAFPKEVIRGIGNSPTMEYYNEYHRLNAKLDELATMCADYIEQQGIMHIRSLPRR